MVQADLVVGVAVAVALVVEVVMVLEGNMEADMEEEVGVEKVVVMVDTSLENTSLAHSPQRGHVLLLIITK